MTIVQYIFPRDGIETSMSNTSRHILACGSREPKELFIPFAVCSAGMYEIHQTDVLSKCSSRHRPYFVPLTLGSIPIEELRRGKGTLRFENRQ
jgi:hypothetical protein